MMKKKARRVVVSAKKAVKAPLKLAHSPRSPKPIIAGKNASIKDPQRLKNIEMSERADGRMYFRTREFKPRSALMLLTKQILVSEYMTEEELEKSIIFAVRIRDSKYSGPREVLRAIETLEAIRQRGIDVAMFLHKMEKTTTLRDVETEELQVIGGRIGTNEQLRKEAEELAMRAIS